MPVSRFGDKHRASRSVCVVGCWQTRLQVVCHILRLRRQAVSVSATPLAVAGRCLVLPHAAQGLADQDTGGALIHARFVGEGHSEKWPSPDVAASADVVGKVSINFQLCLSKNLWLITIRSCRYAASYVVCCAVCEAAVGDCGKGAWADEDATCTATRQCSMQNPGKRALHLTNMMVR